MSYVSRNTGPCSPVLYDYCWMKKCRDFGFSLHLTNKYHLNLQIGLKWWTLWNSGASESLVILQGNPFHFILNLVILVQYIVL